MKLKYAKILILVLAVTSFSACWWESDEDYIDVPTLTFYDWETSVEDGTKSIFMFREDGRGMEEVWIRNQRQPETSSFIWDWHGRRRSNYLELVYDRGRRVEYLDNVRMDRRRAEMTAEHFMSEDDFRRGINGVFITLYGIR